jgi:hypothetical protein
MVCKPSRTHPPHMESARRAPLLLLKTMFLAGRGAPIAVRRKVREHNPSSLDGHARRNPFHPHGRVRVHRRDQGVGAERGRRRSPEASWATPRSITSTRTGRRARAGRPAATAMITSAGRKGLPPGARLLRRRDGDSHVCENETNGAFCSVSGLPSAVHERAPKSRSTKPYTPIVDAGCCSCRPPALRSKIGLNGNRRIADHSEKLLLTLQLEAESKAHFMPSS